MDPAGVLLISFGPYKSQSIKFIQVAPVSMFAVLSATLYSLLRFTPAYIASTPQLSFKSILKGGKAYA